MDANNNALHIFEFIYSELTDKNHPWQKSPIIQLSKLLSYACSITPPIIEGEREFVGDIWSQTQTQVWGLRIYFRNYPVFVSLPS